MGLEQVPMAFGDFLMNNWPQMSIGVALGIGIAWRRWVPSKWAQILNAVKKGHSYGVLGIRLRSKVFKDEVVDFSKPVARTPYGAYNPHKCLAGYRDGVPVAYVTTEDPDSVPLFQNDYRSDELKNPANFSDALDMAFAAGQLSQKNEDKRMFYLAVATAIACAIIIFLLWDERGKVEAIGTGINNFAANVAGNFAKLLGGSIQQGTGK